MSPELPYEPADCNNRYLMTVMSNVSNRDRTSVRLELGSWSRWGVDERVELSSIYMLTSPAYFFDVDVSANRTRCIEPITSSCLSTTYIDTMLLRNRTVSTGGYLLSLSQLQLLPGGICVFCRVEVWLCIVQGGVGSQVRADEEEVSNQPMCLHVLRADWWT